MFDFERLQVYQKARSFNVDIEEFSSRELVDNVTKDQLHRAALSVVLNIAEGSGRNSRADKRRFHVMARGSVFECAAIIDMLYARKLIELDA